MTREHHRARPLRAAARLAAVLALWGLASSPVLAQDSSPEEIGLGIAREAAARNDGFGNFTANLTMVLRNRQGQESRRQIRFKVLEVEDDAGLAYYPRVSPASAEVGELCETSFRSASEAVRALELRLNRAIYWSARRSEG